MSALDNLRTAIVNKLRAAIPDAKTVETHGGRVNLGEINRISKRPPAILVSIINGNGSIETPSQPIRLTVLFSAFVIAKDKVGADRDVVALSIAEQIVAQVAEWPWRGNAEASPPTELNLESIYSGGTDQKGVALLAVTWKHSLPIGTDRFEAERTLANLPDLANPDGLTVAGTVHGSNDPEAVGG